MKRLNILLAAGVMFATGIADADEPVEAASSELAEQQVDTRNAAVREISRLADILPFVFVDGGTITVTDADGGSMVELTGEEGATAEWTPFKVGGYAATNGALSAAFHVNQFVCDFAFDGGGEYDYLDGEEVKPSFTLWDGDYTLVENIDYTAVYADNLNPGTATLTLTGIGKYAAMGTVVKTFTILINSTLNNQVMDTRDSDEGRILNGLEELLAFVYNNVASWPVGGDQDAAAAVLRMTPMIGIPGECEGWLPAGEPTTLVTVPGEHTLDWIPTDGYTYYQAEMQIGGEIVETVYLNLTGVEIEDRATVTVQGGAAMTANAAAIEGQAIEGGLTYRWYVYDPTNRWHEGVLVAGLTFTPGAAHYEKAMRVLAFDDRGYAGMSDELWCSKLPVVYIMTENGQAVVDKNVEVAAKMTIQGNSRFTGTEEMNLTMHARGNTTADAPKKPYKIKLEDKTKLLGMPKSKHWVLLSNPYDFSLLRNKTAYDLSAEMGLTAMESQWVDVILNGEFVGNYQLCEHIRIDEKRVDIFDWESEADEVAGTIAATNGFAKTVKKELETYLEQNLGWVTSGQFTWTNGATYVLGDYGIDISRYDISGGYLFELDRFDDEVTTFNTGTSDRRIEVLTKANRPEYLNSNAEMLGVAKTLWNDYWAACVAPDGYYQGVHYTEMCSLDSMVAYWLVQTIMGQRDYVWSRYAYKDNDGGLLTWGPAWDFDNSCGGRSNWTFDPNGAIISRPDDRSGWGVGNYRYAADAFYQEWIDDPYFVLKAVEKVNEMKDYLDELIKTNGLMDANIGYIFESGVANASRWEGKITQYYSISPFVRFDGENGDAAWFKENLTARIGWIRHEFRSLRAAVASLRTNNSMYPYTDAAEKFAFDFVTKHWSRPVEGEGEGATPDIMLANNLDLEVRVALTGMTDPKTVDVYVNGISNGTYAVSGDTVAFTVGADEFTNVGGRRNMISLVAKNGEGSRLATTYSLVSTVDEANAPQAIGNAMVTVDVKAEAEVTGQPIVPAVTVTTGEGEESVTLVEGEDYLVEYFDNVGIGTATVRITGLGNLLGVGEFPRGNWVGVREYQFEIVARLVSSQVATRQYVDTRDVEVRKLLRSDELLKFAWNNAADWPQGGDGLATVTVTLQSMTGSAAEPADWTESGAARTVVNAAGEGVKRVRATRLENSLYKATLSVGAEFSEEAYFDLTEMEKVPSGTVIYIK